MGKHIEESAQKILGCTRVLSVGQACSDAPAGWAWVKLTDVARLESGHTPSRSHPEYWDGSIPWISIPDAHEHHGEVIFGTEQCVTPAGIENSAARVLPAGTVCLSRTASVGYSVVMGREMATSQDFVNWICGEALEPRFLQLVFLAEGENLRRFGKGTTHTTIYFPEVLAFQICLPPVPEQRRIVAKLDALLARSRRTQEALDALPALIEHFRQSVLAAAFRGDLTRDWREQHPDVEPASRLLERIRAERRRRWEAAELNRMRARGNAPKDGSWKQRHPEPVEVDQDELPELPEGWCWASTDEVAEIAGGLTKNGSRRDSAVDRAPLVSVAAVQLRRIDRSAIGTIGLLPEDGDKGQLRRGDVLLVEGNGSLAHIGRVAQWNVEVEGARHQNHIIRLRPYLLSPTFLLEWLASPLGRNAIIAEATSAAGLYTLSLSKVARLPVALPPLEEQEQIVALVRRATESATHIADELEGAARRLAHLESALFSKAFRGELVQQDPADEPASALLERIRAAKAEPDEDGAVSRRRGPKTKVA